MSEQKTAPARPRNSFRAELPLILLLLLVWGAVWQDFSPGNMIFGLMIAVVMVRTLYLPPVHLSGRFNLLWFLVFLGKFVGWIAAGSLDVFWLAIRPRSVPASAIIGVRLRTTDDLIMTAVAQITSLVPGSLVVEVDRRSATIYFHVINVSRKAQAEDFRHEVLSIEELVVRVMGSKEQLRSLSQDRPVQAPPASSASSASAGQEPAVEGMAQHGPRDTHLDDAAETAALGETPKKED